MIQARAGGGWLSPAKRVVAGSSPVVLATGRSSVGRAPKHRLPFLPVPRIQQEPEAVGYLQNKYPTVTTCPCYKVWNGAGGGWLSILWSAGSSPAGAGNSTVAELERQLPAAIPCPVPKVCYEPDGYGYLTLGRNFRGQQLARSFELN